MKMNDPAINIRMGIIEATTKGADKIILTLVEKLVECRYCPYK